VAHILLNFRFLNLIVSIHTSCKFNGIAKFNGSVKLLWCCIKTLENPWLRNRLYAAHWLTFIHQFFRFLYFHILLVCNAIPLINSFLAAIRMTPLTNSFVAIIRVTPLINSFVVATKINNQIYIIVSPVSVQSGNWSWLSTWVLNFGLLILEHFPHTAFSGLKKIWLGLILGHLRHRLGRPLNFVNCC